MTTVTVNNFLRLFIEFFLVVAYIFILSPVVDRVDLAAAWTQLDVTDSRTTSLNFIFGVIIIEWICLTANFFYCLYSRYKLGWNEAFSLVSSSPSFSCADDDLVVHWVQSIA
jgi:hypothetical protein